MGKLNVGTFCDAMLKAKENKNAVRHMVVPTSSHLWGAIFQVCMVAVVQRLWEVPL